MSQTSSALAIILSSGGSKLDLRTVQDMPVTRIVKAELATSEHVSCVTATVEHSGNPDELRGSLQDWAGTRGWLVTVASLTEAR